MATRCNSNRNSKAKRWALWLFALVLILGVAAPAHAQIRGMAEVVDGHTLDIAGERVRLHGIFAPRPGQVCTVSGTDYDCGAQSAAMLAELVDDHALTCTEEGRMGAEIVAVCFVEGRDVSSWMARSGWALAYLDHSVNYMADEGEARANNAGLWQGEFEKPWEWEARHR